MATIAPDLQNYVDNAGTAVARSENKLLHSRRGRIGVFSHAARTLLAFVIIVLAIVPFAVIVSMVGDDPTTTIQNLVIIASTILSLVGVVYGILLGMVSTVKRLHDLDMSGWFYLVCVIPGIGMLFYLYVSLKRGGEGNNKYGAPSIISSREKIFGYIGMALILLLVAATTVQNFVDMKALIGA